MDKIPEIKNVLQVFKQGAENQFHSIKSNEDVTDSIKLSVFDILFSFSNLEETLDSFAYLLYTDIADTLGIIETEGFTISKKIELFRRKMYLSKKNFNMNPFPEQELSNVVKMLKGSSQIRNTIAHIKWHSLFSIEGFHKKSNESEEYELYFHKYKLNKTYNLETEYVNCTANKLSEMRRYIDTTNNLLSNLRRKYENLK